MLNAKLIVVGGDAKKTEVRLKLPTVIGRGKEAGLTVPHALVSRRHTEIFERNGRLFVRDMGSLNGTYVNNTRIDGEQALEPNQLLTLGNITFRAVYEVESDAPVVTPPGSETVSDDEVKTLPDIEMKESIQVQTFDGKEQLSSISDVMSFDETVPVDLISSKVQPVDSSKPASIPVTSQENIGPHDSTEPVIINEENRPDKVGGDTDKSFVEATTSDGSTIGSSFYSVETDEVDPANKSISASGLDDLPAVQSAVSFAGNLDTGDEIKDPISQIDPGDINLADEQPQAKIEDDSSLGSFLKKLPR